MKRATLSFVVLLGLFPLSHTAYRWDSRKTFIFTFGGTWVAAIRECQRLHLQLLTIDSMEKNENFVHKGQFDTITSYWLAGLDLGEEDGGWTWYYDGQPINQTFWMQGEPTEGDNNCLEVVNNGAKRNWKATNCDEKRSFICVDEKEDWKEDEID